METILQRQGLQIGDRVTNESLHCFLRSVFVVVGSTENRWMEAFGCSAGPSVQVEHESSKRQYWIDERCWKKGTWHRIEQGEDVALQS